MANLTDAQQARRDTPLYARGYYPGPHERDALAYYIHETLTRALRKRISIKIIHGNSWSGWLENGNPHGDPRPGPIATPKGILDWYAPRNHLVILQEERLALSLRNPRDFLRITGV